jgi:acetylornithine deacetylase/succinyl-diaminopimelate desuccinylase-like protein
VDALELLRELVRVPSVNPPGDGEGRVAELLREPLDGAGLETDVLVSPAGRPSLVARLPGPTDRPPLVLLSHSDVVPVEPDAWTHDPFGGETHDGHVWGRGTLDMKGIAVLHAQAVIDLAGGGATPDREVLVVVVADEEAGGGEGARWLVDEHPARVGFHDEVAPEVLGEGGFGLSGVLDRPVLPIVVGEKSPLWLRATARGEAGHASMPPEEQAIRRLTRFVAAVSGSRSPHLHPVVREQFAALAEAAGPLERQALRVLAGPVGPAALRLAASRLRAVSPVLGHLVADTITPTQLDAGYKTNVVPGSAEATFDARLLPDTDVERLLDRLRRLGDRHGVDVEAEERWSSPVSPRGPLFDVLAEVSAELPGDPVPTASLTPGVTDLRYFRRRGATAYGWVPLVLTPELLATFHGTDERVPLEGFRAAEQAMTSAVRRVASTPGEAVGGMRATPR